MGSTRGTTGMSLSYQPTCSIDALKARAKLYNQIRQFFAERDVMEVERQLFHKQALPMYI